MQIRFTRRIKKILSHPEDGMIISYANNNYGVQLCLCWAYTNLLIRSKSNSAWSKWMVIKSIDI